MNTTPDIWTQTHDKQKLEAVLKVLKAMWQAKEIPYNVHLERRRWWEFPPPEARKAER